MLPDFVCVLCVKIEFALIKLRLQNQLHRCNEEKTDTVSVFVSPSAIVPLWRPDWSRRLRTSSFPAGLGAGHGH